MNIVRRVAIALALILVPALAIGAVLVQRDSKAHERDELRSAIVNQARDQARRLGAR